MTMQPVQGSDRAPMPGARDVGDADPQERLEVTVMLRQPAGDDLKARLAALAAGDKSTGFLSREAYAQQFGADPADIAAVTAFAQAHGLVVVISHPERRTMVLSGTVAQFNAAFGVTLRRFEHPDGTYRGRTGQVHVPPELAGIVQAVLGLDNRPQAGPHFRIPPGRVNVLIPSAAPLAAAPSGFTPAQVAALYNYPPGDGAGQCVAIIELGGGYRPADLTTYFSSVGVSPAPKVLAVSVDNAQNKPVGNPDSADGEVLLDIEVVGSVAPGATIAVYFAPNTDAGFTDAVLAAVHDTANKPSVISISWGGPESSWTAQAMTALDQAIQAAVVMGVTVCVASGDSGSSDGASGDNVDFPASSPHALACGGTTLVGSGTAITSESVWNEQSAGGGAGGGGVSAVFATPAWQAGLSATMTSGDAAPLAFRGVPDVCGDADPATGYQILVDGETQVFGGTSAVAPLWAGLLARINGAKGGPSGLVQPLLYANAAAMNDITVGNNGDFAATVGWDACTGLGSPDGVKVAAALST
jgi:kumamolisin